MVRQDAAYRGRSDKFDPFESLIGSRAILGEDQASNEWKVGIRTWAPPCSSGFRTLTPTAIRRVFSCA